MDHIDTYLATATQKSTYSPSIRAALAIGKTTLNWYYNKTDYSEVYRIAMGTICLIYGTLLIIFQFSTLVTSFIISRRLDGMMTGSKQLAQSFATSLIVHMHLWTSKRMWIQQPRYDLIFYLHTLSAPTWSLAIVAVVIIIYQYV